MKSKDPMGDIDTAASAIQVPGAKEDPGADIAPLTIANYGGINSLQQISMAEQCPGSTCEYTNASFNDDVAQYRKTEADSTASNNLAELNRVRNQAFNMVDETQDNTKPPFTGRQDSDPKGG